MVGTRACIIFDVTIEFFFLIRFTLNIESLLLLFLITSRWLLSATERAFRFILFQYNPQVLGKFLKQTKLCKKSPTRLKQLYPFKILVEPGNFTG